MATDDAKFQKLNLTVVLGDNSPKSEIKGEIIRHREAKQEDWAALDLGLKIIKHVYNRKNISYH